MFDYSQVAVEIWHQILLAVIDMPYVLDTLVDREPGHYRTLLRYHDRQVYADSECQRKMLRLVCHSWRVFADGYKYRWIIYNTHVDADPREQQEAMEAIHSLAAAHNSASWDQQQGPYITSRPRRILFHVTTEKDMDILRTTMDNISNKATTFFIKCEEGYEDQIFRHVITQNSRLPMLRCLSIPVPNDHPRPLRALSAALPKLITLSLNRKLPYKIKDGDLLLLPDLEILKLELSASDGASLRGWDLRGMIHLTTAIGISRIGRSMMNFEPLQSLGANIIYLDLYKLHVPIQLPVEFWAWCPCLMEFLGFFSWIHFDTPAPSSHPLREVVHWPAYDKRTNPFIVGASTGTMPAVLHNLCLLPTSLGVFVMRKTWSDYLVFLKARYRQPDREYILNKMNKICAERSIRVEDQEKVLLHEFLVREGIWEERIS